MDTVDSGVKTKENKKKYNYLDLAIKLKKKKTTMEHEVLPILIGVLGTVPNCWGKRDRRLENQRTSQNHPDHSITQNRPKY